MQERDNEIVPVRPRRPRRSRPVIIVILLAAAAAVLLALGAEEVYLCCLTKTLDNAPAPAAWPGANHSL